GDQVQIYESVMGDTAGLPTTVLLNGVRFIKDSRLLPDGFDKATASPDIAVVGTAANDADFRGGQDRVQYVVDPGTHTGPFQIEAELRFQSIGFRWAENLRRHESAEPKRFLGYYSAMSQGSSEVLARTTGTAASR